MYCFFFNDTATTEIYTLSLHDALPISGTRHGTQLPLHGHGETPFRHAPRSSASRMGTRLDLKRRAHQHATQRDRKSTRLNSSHANISYAVFCLKKKNQYPSRFLPAHYV